MTSNIWIDILTAIIAPLFIPIFEQILPHPSDSNPDFRINHLYGKKQKNPIERQTPDKDIIESPKTIDSAIIPFFRGLPSAYVGNVIWGITYGTNQIGGWFVLYIVLLVFSLFFIAYIKTHLLKHKKIFYCILTLVEIGFIILSLLRLDALPISIKILFNGN